MCVCPVDKKMREDRHNSCIMIVTSEAFMIYLCFLFVTDIDMFLLTKRDVWLEGMEYGCKDGIKRNKKKNVESISPSQF